MSAKRLAFKQMAPMLPPKQKPRACVPCHERKVRCDFAVVGTPCTRCVSKDRTASCVPVPRLDKSDANKRKRASDDADGRSRRPGIDGDVQADEHANGSLPEIIEASARTPTSTSTRRDGQPSPSQPSFSIASPLQTPLSSVQGPLALSGSYHLRASQPEYSMSEDDAHLQTLCRMSQSEPVVLTPPSVVGAEQQPLRVVEYYSDLNALSLLNDALGKPNRRKLVQVSLASPQVGSAKQRELSCLDDIDRAYLAQRKVHEMPSTSSCDSMMRLFFKYVYPYTPVVDRMQLAIDYRQGSCSSFLIYAIFAITIPYASLDLVHAMAFKSITEAQKEFFTRARLLYDFGCEKNQLNILQACVFMSSFQNSFAPDKDFRFWFNNATHIATLMGLHRRNIERDLDPSMHRVCRRIWWLLFQRDVMFSLAGFENVRLLRDEEADTLPLCEDDWKDAAEVEAVQDILYPTSVTQMKFLVENCKLTQLGARCLRLLRISNAVPPMDEVRDISKSIASWRSALPSELKMEGVSHWDDASIWIIVILTFSFRLECLFYRSIRRRTEKLNIDDTKWINQRLHGAMFEMSSLLRRAMAYEILQSGPPSMIVCTTQLMALQIEAALSRDCSRAQRRALKAEIHTVLSYFQDIEDTWLNAKWASRVFAFVVKQTGLSLNEIHEESSSTHKAAQNVGNGVINTRDLNGDDELDLSRCQNAQSLEFLEALPENWLQDMIDQGVLDQQDQAIFEVFRTSL